MTLDSLIELFTSAGCNQVLAKRLAANDNSKNQVFVGGSFEVLNQIPFGTISLDSSKKAGSKKDRLKAPLRFAWLTEDGHEHLAPNATLILYPKYPEVRLSGFLQGSDLSRPKKDLMASRQEGRFLFFGIRGRELLGWIASPTDDEAEQARAKFASLPDSAGVLRTVWDRGVIDNDDTALLGAAISQIHSKGWIDSWRLGKNGEPAPCESAHCGGLTLEAELGIRQNSKALPDYEGWEVKSLDAKDQPKFPSKSLTLMTPEPDSGYYVEKGPERFVREFGYPDKNGKADRLNFGGVHRANQRHHLTGLQLTLEGWNSAAGKIESTSARLALITPSGLCAAGWSLEKLLVHWSAKHARAAFIPSSRRMDPKRQYSYGRNLLLGRGANIGRVFSAVTKGDICLDPAIKVENASSSHPKVKRRNQFRIAAKSVHTLYDAAEWFDVISGEHVAISTD